MTNHLQPVLAALRGFLSSHASPTTLLVCIIVIPAIIAFTVLSYVLRQAEKDEDEGHYSEDTAQHTMMSTREWFAQRYVPCALEADKVKNIPLVKFTHGLACASSATSFYASSAAMLANSSCVVCLTTFLESEELKVLPPCQHAFHPNCIDPWFETNSTCPICRCEVTVLCRDPEAFLDSRKLTNAASIDLVIE